MSFPIERGLFKFDGFTDYYAILGIPVDAGADEIRKRYLKIARRLHPDSCKAETPAEKQRASQMLSKMVNPAYEQLSQDRSRNEYVIVLGRMGKRLAADGAKIQLQSEAAKQLFQAGGNLDHVYRTSLQNLAKTQYEVLEKDKVFEVIAQISELNMVYLMKKQGEGLKSNSSSSGAKTANPLPSSAGSSPRPEEKKVEPTVSAVEPYCRRAEEYMVKGAIAKAILELRDALQQEPSNSRAHALLGIAYLRERQATMAKVHINKALQLNPQEPEALRGKEVLDKMAQKAAGKTAPESGGKTSPGKPNDKSGGGGLFGGLFGGKKK